MLDKLIGGIKDSLNLGGKSLIGVDIGLSQVKVAEVKKSGNSYKLIGYAAVDLPEGSLIEDDIQKPDEISAALEQALSKLKSSAQLVALGLFGPNTVAKKLQLAGGSEEEIEDQVQWEAGDYLPFDPDDSEIGHHIFGENEGGGIDVLVAAARKDIIEVFKDLVEQTKLKVKIIDLSVVAITNVFEHVFEDKLNDPNSSWILLDIGAQITKFIIYRKNSIVFSKEMNIGGVIITEEIQRQMGVNYIEAEDLKIMGDENGNLPEEIIEIIDDVLEAFYTEIKKTVDFYITSTSDELLKECIVTGGGALIPGLIEGLEALLGFGITIMNPFDRFDYDKKKIKDDVKDSIAFRGGVAIGLAMREVP